MTEADYGQAYEQREPMITTSKRPYGEGKPKCGISLPSRPGENCRRPAGWGTPHPGIGACKRHGGSTPGHIEAAKKVMIRTMANAYGIPRHIDPADGLIEEYWRTAGIVSGLEKEVAKLPPGELVWGVAEISQDEAAPAGGDGQPAAVRSVKKRSGLNALVKLFNEERDRFARLGVEIVRLGLEARRDEYIRAQVEVFASVLLSPDLGLSQGQRETAARLLRGLGEVRVIPGQIVE